MNLSSLFGLARSLGIYYGQPWKSRALRRFYRDLVGPGDLCFDIGAHVGSRSRALMAAGAHVVALEPQPDFASFLRRVMPDTGFTLVEQGVGREQGALELHVSSRHPTVSTLSPGWIDDVAGQPGFARVRWDRRVRVEVTTLDLLIDRFGPPAFCKIDVEGMESEILEGLSTPVALVAVEYVPAALGIAFACIDRLEALGAYRYNRVEGERHVFLHERWLDARGMREALRGCAGNGRSGDLYARLSP